MTSVDLLPVYPEFRKISLDDRLMFENLLNLYPPDISERTFGSIYAWRGYGGRSELAQLEGHLIVSWHKKALGRVMLEPIGPNPASVIDLIARSSSAEDSSIEGFYGLVEPLVSELRLIGREPKTLRDDWDYVYLTRNLIELSGPKYHTQRKEMKKATLEHDIVFEPMTKEHQAQCLELEEKWCDLKHCTYDRLSEAEDVALRESVANLDALGFIGGVLLVDGKLEALTVGERLNPKTAVVHFEKANPMIRGLYQVINQQFCEQILKDFEFTNREQDVGEPGLRRAKEGYHPHHYVEKHLLLIG